MTLAPNPCRRSRRTADPSGADLGVVAFGLASAISWGAGDFGGGWTGRRASVYAIAIVVDVVGIAAMLPVALASG